MISQFIKGRVYVFIDAANIFYTQRTLRWRISYEKLMQYFKNECGKNIGKTVIILSAKNHISRELIKLSDKYINLKNLRDKIELKIKSPR